ncbi:hypothetical protein BABINDRAFT_159378 [Babjeviella inositovora NRRL Y-12698]|uniref:Uncharacterized protein n=1 Tax=Babjeviella inositovora NRRL Y-12698 TaxID=984486 RepID=A0A1E3QYY9_9ASCO|nr:uncharacterized protein BABINDRAFT_159378 [Babjeviella inositovora NRRL Y-12698]ODQ82883.1 hypothetical protein BABINDRAFT_159378 [Babjeviella inositovora NRRL Y-12698]
MACVTGLISVPCFAKWLRIEDLYLGAKTRENLVGVGRLGCLCTTSLNNFYQDVLHTNISKG